MLSSIAGASSKAGGLWGVGVTDVCCRTTPEGMLTLLADLGAGFAAALAVPCGSVSPPELPAARSVAAKLRGVVLAFLGGGRINEEEES